MRASGPPRAPGSPLPGAAKATAWTLGVWAAMQLSAVVFARNAIAVLAVQAAIAEWGAGRLAITWSDPLAPAPSGTELRQRGGLGAAFGLAAATLVVLLSLAMHQASVGPAAPALASLLLGVLVAVLGAVRDELLLRGMVLRIGRPLVGTPVTLLVCAAAAAAVRSGAADTTALAIAVEGARGLALSLLWIRDRGAWMPIAANSAWTWGLDSVTRGDLLDVRFRAEPGSSVQALVVLIVVAAAAAWWVRRSTQARASA